MKSISKTLLSTICLLSLQGCGMIYKTTGDILINYSRAEMVPYLMATDDTAMACATGESLTPLLMSFSRVGSHPEKLGVLVNTVAASCAEERALEAELRYLRAMKAGDVSEAQDARSVQKQFAKLAAQRQYQSYQLTINQFGEPRDDVCPRFRRDFDELVWMVGLIGGVQALLNDATAETSVGVPRNVAAMVERGAGCLENDKWWGVPDATRAALWSILPMLKPEVGDAWQTLSEAREMGFEKGTRLPAALYAMSAYGVNDQQRTREAVRSFYQTEFSIDPEYRMLDAIAHVLVSGISDRMWTEATGQRTPFGRLGSFWDDQKSRQQSFDIDDLL